MRLALRGLVAKKILSECSTPFGIYEVGTDTFPQRHEIYTCAQRLSASMRLAPQTATAQATRPVSAQRLSASMRLARNNSRQVDYRQVQCSTPFGIYEVGTRLVVAIFYHACQVLNAFRHL